MVTKAILLIMLSSLLVTTLPASQSKLPSQLTNDAPPPPSDSEPPWYQDLLDSLSNSLSAAGEEISRWIDGAFGALQESIAQAISQFWQGLIDEVVRVATQTLQNLLNQTCGAVLLLPAGVVTGVWLVSRRRHG